MERGYVLYETGSVVIIATLHSENDKTGDMIQVWMLVRETSPWAAVKSGENKQICFDCPLIDACYVIPWQGPRAVWEAWQRGLYEYLPLENYDQVFRGREVRFGAYGDPVLIPILIVIEISRISDGWTGYTHQWRRPEFQKYKPYFMASCESVADVWKADEMGWRSFRPRAKNDFPLMLIETECPASEEMGRRTTCEDCLLCNGKRGPEDRRKHITTPVHGRGAAKFVEISL